MALLQELPVQDDQGLGIGSKPYRTLPGIPSRKQNTAAAYFSNAKMSGLDMLERNNSSGIMGNGYENGPAICKHAQLVLWSAFQFRGVFRGACPGSHCGRGALEAIQATPGLGTNPQTSVRRGSCQPRSIARKRILITRSAAVVRLSGSGSPAWCIR